MNYIGVCTPCFKTKLVYLFFQFYIPLGFGVSHKLKLALRAVQNSYRFPRPMVIRFFIGRKRHLYPYRDISP